jgi:hypothetical protein
MSVPSSFVEVRGRLLSMVFFFSVGAGRMEERKMRIGSFVVRCYEFDRMLAFWREALHYVPREPAQEGWVVLHDPEGRGPNVSLERFPEPLEHIGKTSRVHLDLYTNDQDGEVERLVGIGATQYSPRKRATNTVCCERLALDCSFGNIRSTSTLRSNRRPAYCGRWRHVSRTIPGRGPNGPDPPFIR